MNALLHDPISLALIASTAGTLAWAVKTLWRLDRRLVRVETKLGFTSSEESI